MGLMAFGQRPRRVAVDPMRPLRPTMPNGLAPLISAPTPARPIGPSISAPTPAPVRPPSYSISAPTPAPALPPSGYSIAGVGDPAAARTAAAVNNDPLSQHLGGRAVTGGNPFYNPDQNWGPGKDMYDAPIVRDGNGLSSKLPGGEYERLMTQLGQTGFGKKADWMRGEAHQRAQKGYQAAQLSSPGLTWRNYLNEFLGGNALDNAWRSMTPEQRGANMQSRTQVISRG